MTQAPDYFVVFGDLLGFKRLVLENKVPFDYNLNFRNRPLLKPLGSLANTGNALSRAFNAFHGGINSVLESTAWTRPISLYVFSDSVFLVAEAATDALEFGEQLMRLCLQNEAPLRQGIGYGSFVRYGFSFEETPVTTHTSSQFFGSGVIYATEAEKALTEHGMRIAVHKSAAEAITSGSYRAEKLLTVTDLASYVTHEWNYLPEWAENPRRYNAKEDPDPNIPATLMNRIEQMHARVAADDKKLQRQYEDSKAALVRMTKAMDDFRQARKAKHGS